MKNNFKKLFLSLRGELTTSLRASQRRAWQSRGNATGLLCRCAHRNDRLLILAILIALPLTGQAITITNENSSKVNNQIDISANTGNQNASADTQQTNGQSSVKIDVENEINGQSVDPIHIDQKSEAGKDIKVEVNQKVNATGTEAQVEKQVKINDQIVEQSSTTQRIQQSAEQPKKLGVLVQVKNTIQKNTQKFSNWMSVFLGNLKNKLANIFKIFK